MEKLGLESLLLAQGDAHVLGVTLRAAAGRVHVNRCMGQGIALALCAGAEQNRSHAGRHADSKRMYRRLDHFHRVIYGQAGVNKAARAVDEHLDRLVRVFRTQVEQLGNDQIGYLVGKRHAEKDNAFLQQEAVDIIGALAPARTLDNHRHDIRRRQAAHLKLVAGKARPTLRFSIVWRFRRLARMRFVERMKHLDLPFSDDDNVVNWPRNQPVVRRIDFSEQCYRNSVKCRRCTCREM